MTLNVGSLFDSRYEILKEIGSGGTSNVYEAYDQINKNNVAIKFFKNTVEENETLYKEFVNECMIVSCLNNQNIVSIYNSGIYESHPYIVSELIKGDTLKSILDKRHCLTIEESLDIMIQLMNALSYAHIHQCIHKDVKPHNMYIQNDGTMKLGDFGISEIIHADKDKERKIVGTVQYCAPEIFEGHKASVSSDIYASGIVFYEMLTGNVPFDENSVKETALAHIRNKFQDIKKSIKNCPKNLDKLILKSVDKNPKKRYQNCDEFLDKLLAFKKAFYKEKNKL